MSVVTDVTTQPKRFMADRVRSAKVVLNFGADYALGLAQAYLAMILEKDGVYAANALLELAAKYNSQDIIQLLPEAGQNLVVGFTENPRDGRDLLSKAAIFNAFSQEPHPELLDYCLSIVKPNSRSKCTKEAAGILGKFCGKHSKEAFQDYLSLLHEMLKQDEKSGPNPCIRSILSRFLGHRIKLNHFIRKCPCILEGTLTVVQSLF